MKPARIYSLPRTLSEEEVAVVMAKTSRSPLPFDEIAQEITKEKASEFHQKYVVSYGHASVAECAVPNFVLENVSILASKILESLPRPAYQEKSTRYQDFTSRATSGGVVYDSYLIPEELRKHDVNLLNKYIAWMDYLFSQYEKFKTAMNEFAERAVGEEEKARANKVRIKAFDSLRYVLP